MTLKRRRVASRFLHWLKDHADVCQAMLPMLDPCTAVSFGQISKWGRSTFADFYLEPLLQRWRAHGASVVIDTVWSLRPTLFASETLALIAANDQNAPDVVTAWRYVLSMEMSRVDPALDLRWTRDFLEQARATHKGFTVPRLVARRVDQDHLAPDEPDDAGEVPLDQELGWQASRRLAEALDGNRRLWSDVEEMLAYDDEPRDPSLVSTVLARLPPEGLAGEFTDNLQPRSSIFHTLRRQAKARLLFERSIQE